MTEKHQEYLESISEIRNIMDRSSRFISFSGLAGVFAGIFALGGATFAYYVLIELQYPYSVDPDKTTESILLLFLDAAVTLILAIGSGLIFTSRKTKKEGGSLWDKKVLVVVWNLAVPLAAGGAFCLILMYYSFFYDNRFYLLVPPATLIFYGLALFNAGNYTHKDIKQLGVFEIALGLANCLFLGKGLYFWAFGFGVMHIIYGIIMYFKYDKK